MTLLKKLQWSIGLLLFFFVLPVIAGQLPFNKQASTPMKQPEDKQVVFAATNLEEESELEKTKEQTEESTPESTPKSTSEPTKEQDPFKVLLLFTHSQEAYQPIVKAVSGKVVVYDDKTNIYNLQGAISKHFSMNGIQTDVLDVDVMKVMKSEGKTFPQAYNTVRPYLSNRLQEQSYNLIIDLHRDSVPNGMRQLLCTTINHMHVLP